MSIDIQEFITLIKDIGFKKSSQYNVYDQLYKLIKEETYWEIEIVKSMFGMNRYYYTLYVKSEGIIQDNIDEKAIQYIKETFKDIIRNKTIEQII